MDSNATGTAASGTLRDRRKRETREAIQGAARQLFDSEGFEGTTIRAVAARAGVGVGTVHLHFQDKESLLLACLTQDIIENDRRSWRSMPVKAPVKEQLLHLAREGFRGWMGQPSLSRVILRRMFFSQHRELDQLRALDADVLRRVTGLLAGARDRGEVRADIDPALATKGFFSFYLLASLGWLGGKDHDSGEGWDGTQAGISKEGLDALVEETRAYLNLMFEGIGPENGGER